MSRRTSIVLDDASSQALRDLARHLGCSASEVVRRALMSYRERVVGVPVEKRRRRRAALEALIASMDGHDWRAELAALKEQDELG